MKKFLITIVFAIMCLMLSGVVSNIIRFKQYSTISKSIFYREHIDYDVIFFGSSIVHYSISPLYLFKQHGLSSYNLSVPGCQFSELYALTKEAIKTKKTSIYVVEYTALLNPSSNGVFGRGSILSIRDPLVRFSAYSDNNSFVTSLKDSSIFYNFHNRWKELKDIDFFHTLDFLRGYYSGNHLSQIYTTTDDGKFLLTDEQKSLIDKYINLLNNNGKTLILYAGPITYNHEKYSDTAVRAVEEYVKRYNVDFINMKHKYDIKTDMSDSMHTNFNGGKKLIMQPEFIPHIMEKYHLKDHRDDKRFAYWFKNYEKQERYINKEQIKGSGTKDFGQWFQYSMYDNYTMVISINGDNVLNKLPIDMKDKFKSLGLKKFETDKKDLKYAAIINDGKVFYEEVSDDKVEYIGRMNNVVNLLVSSENNKSIINVSGKRRSKNRYGINFVIYDKVNREVVDSIWLDPSNFNQVRR